MTHPLPSDHETRERFINSPDENFSVIAPAGVGKTKAIVDRIVAIATGPRSREILPRLIVVTYTKKAADEMHQRARNAIIAAGVDLATLSTFNRTFFGTIHSFCVRLLRDHGHLLGLPPALDAAENDDELWADFIRQLGEIAPGFPATGKLQCLRFQPLEKILRLARQVRREHENTAQPPTIPCPLPRLDILLNHQPKGSSKKSIPRLQDTLRRWHQIATSDAPYVPLPENTSTAKEFCELWQSAFGPLETWLKDTSWALAVALARDYRTYRLAQGCLTYDDQISLAYDLVSNPRTAAYLRAENFHIILDEAQDTDPTQFNVLLELARPKTARGIWLQHGGEPPAPGRLCMVGDPQQSIYGSRADLAHYAAIRQKLIEARTATEINFDVTFRCDRAIITTVNHLAAPILHGNEGQASFYKLQPRPDAGPGQVIRIEPPALPTTDADDEAGIDHIALHEARWLATWIAAQGLEKFGANKWSDLAILCPRRRWLETLELALAEHGLVPQVHSDNSIRGDSPAYAWFTALATIMDAPANTFEIAGVLREIYGLPDDALARYTKGDGTKLEIGASENSATQTAGPSVHGVLQSLATLRAEIIALPLRDAMQRLVDATALRQRLEIIGADASELDALLSLASIAESRGDSLHAFTQNLRDEFEAEIPARPVNPDAVQLFTCHKAKGLQWEAVILPMLFRKISTRQQEYPIVLQGTPGRPPHRVFSSSDIGDLKATLDIKREHETQRLLYVALTRAKKSLVLVDDHALFHEKKTTTDSFADLLGLLNTDAHRIPNPDFDNLPAELVAPAREPISAEPPIELDLPPLDDATLERARKISSDLPTRILPYALAEAQHDREIENRIDEVTAPAEPSADAEAARLYGIWWHELVEAMDWQADTNAREKIAATKLKTCPQPERGAREWKLLRDSNIIERLVTASAIFHTEMPFQYSCNDREWMEGVMDLAIFYPAENRWLVLDWKTNIVTPATAGSLRDLYAPQLNAYAEALAAITNQPVATGVYSTSTGLWIPISP